METTTETRRGRAKNLKRIPRMNPAKMTPAKVGGCSVTRKKSPNVYKSCQKMISLEKLKILTPLQKLPKNVVDLGKLIVATGFEKLPKVL